MIVFQHILYPQNPLTWLTVSLQGAKQFFFVIEIEKIRLNARTHYTCVFNMWMSFHITFYSFSQKLIFYVFINRKRTLHNFWLSDNYTKKISANLLNVSITQAALAILIHSLLEEKFRSPFSTCCCELLTLRINYAAEPKNSVCKLKQYNRVC